MNTRSYEAALKSIAKIEHPGTRIMEAKQKILFRLGTQAFANARFQEALEFFNQSLAVGQYNQATKADAYFWRGESNYRLDRFPQAGNDYRLYLEFATSKDGQEYGLALYNLGYTYFKQKIMEMRALGLPVLWAGEVPMNVPCRQMPITV